MRLKSFHAKSMSDAMRQVRDTLGDDAIIVSSREEGGGWIKITAAVEKTDTPPEHAEEMFAAEDIIEIITDALMKHRVPAGVSDRIISVSMTLAERDPRKALAKALQKTLSFDDPAKKKRKPVALVGPPGAGKTLMAAKLAAREVLNGRKAAVITTDTARAGGVEQLSAFLDILSLPLATAADAKSLRQALSGLRDNAQVIIDTGGLNPFDPQEMKALARLLGVAEMEPTLVLPSGIDAEESAEMARAFAVLGVRHLMPTRLDFARRLGGILNAADRAELSFTEGSHTPQVAEGILTLTPDVLGGLLMPHSPKKGRIKK